MSIFNDFVQFLGSVMMGKKEASKAFLDPLNMAERYLRWAEEREDLRDYMSCLAQLALANDEEAPKAEMIVQKYTCYAEATTGAIRLLMEKHQTVGKNARATHKDLLNEQTTLREQMENAKKRIDTLTSEGSLISAKEEQKHADELEGRCAAVTRAIESGDSSASVIESYGKMADESQRMIEALEQAIYAIELNPTVPGNALGPLREQILGQIEQLRSELAEANPSPPPTAS